MSDDEILDQPDMYGDDAPYTEQLAARRCALDLLGAVLGRRTPLDQILETDEAFPALSVRDRAFVRMLLGTTFRRLGQIDEIINKLTAKPETLKLPVLHHILRLGICQIAFMKVPDHAAVNTSVQLAELHRLERQKAFVNGLLRSFARDRTALLGKQDEVRLNTPLWLMRSWIDDYGLRTAAEIAQSHLTEAPLDITLKHPDQAAHWAEKLEADILPTGTLRRAAGGNVQDLPGYEDGMWWIQDVSAAIPARLFGDLHGRHVIDLCAAPGGKTAQLAAAGATVTAIDRSTQRLKRLQDNMHRLRLDKSVTIAVSDATAWRAREQAGAILVDAPCSATGTIRRHPDMPWLKSEGDIRRVAEMQARILDNAAAMLAPGGTLIYCTCSLQKSEGEDQIAAFLERTPSMRRDRILSEDVGGLTDLINAHGDLRILPTHLGEQGGMDGFFAARLTKTGH